MTGLANRLLFRERLDRAFIRADRNKTLVALYVIDLDRFKNVNDTFGHDAGDKLLVEVGSRLTKCVRKGDTVARLGGDEFTIIMEDVKNFEDTRVIANKILEIIKIPINISSNDIYTGPSIGVSVYPNDSQEPETLMKNADNAMYRAKENGRNNFSFYTSDLGQAINKKMDMEENCDEQLIVKNSYSIISQS